MLIDGGFWGSDGAAPVETSSTCENALGRSDACRRRGTNGKWMAGRSGQTGYWPTGRGRGNVLADAALDGFRSEGKEATIRVLVIAMRKA